MRTFRQRVSFVSRKGRVMLDTHFIPGTMVTTMDDNNRVGMSAMAAPGANVLDYIDLSATSSIKHQEVKGYPRAPGTCTYHGF